MKNKICKLEKKITPVIEINSNVCFLHRLWTFIIIPFTYIFYGKIKIK